MKLDLQNKKRIIVKIGSSLLIKKGEINKSWLKSLIKDIKDITKKGYEVIIVSSGSIALGKQILKQEDSKNKISDIQNKQMLAAIGQIQLMYHYQDLFKKKKINVAQILLTAKDCDERSSYLNLKNTINNLIANKVIPIINENDSLAVDEIKIGDNDRLAARVAQMISADILILLSDVDGLYNKNPKINKDATLISEISKITKDIENFASKQHSKYGSGGMKTKIMAAKMLESSNCETIITNGQDHHILRDIFNGKKDFSIFYSSKKSNLNARKKWLSGFFNIKGKAIINDRAKQALQSNAVSLLPIGVIKIEGEFNKKDVIIIEDENGNHIATGLSNYSAKDSKKIITKNSKQIKETLGISAKEELVHIDNLFINKIS